MEIPHGFPNLVHDNDDRHYSRHPRVTYYQDLASELKCLFPLGVLVEVIHKAASSITFMVQPPHRWSFCRSVMKHET